jgi:DNA-binding LacI/PurR family transcriptional regulator
MKLNDHVNVQLPSKMENRVAPKAPTMRDVAELAGVSVQTVSCVVNGTGAISPETRERVRNVIRQLNYRRDPIARSMRTKQTGLIGLLVLDITNPVLSVIASAVEASAFTEDYSVVLYNVGEEVCRQWEYLTASAESLIDGLIIVNAIDHTETLAFLAEDHITAVLIDCLAAGDIPSVAVDNIKAAYMATEHAIELGHKRIAHIAGSSTLVMAQQRQQGYEQALLHHDLAYRKVVVSKGERWNYQAGYETMQELLASDPLPTAVFAASDQMAIGAYRAIAEAGLRVPDDFSIIGFDDIDAAAFAVPALTTIRQPFAEIASNAVSLLLKLIAGEQPAVKQVVLSPELIVRQSTARVV